MGQNTELLWGYHHQYQIAEIKNATLEEVVSQGVNVEAIADKAAPSAADWTLLSFVYMADGRRVGTDRPADKDL